MENVPTDYILLINNSCASVKSKGWLLMQEVVTGSVRPVIETAQRKYELVGWRWPAISNVGTDVTSSEASEPGPKMCSAQSVTRIIPAVDSQLVVFRQIPLPMDLLDVWLDGCSINVSAEHKVRPYRILAAPESHRNGRLEIPSFRLAESDSEQLWREFLHQ